MRWIAVMMSGRIHPFGRILASIALFSLAMPGASGGQPSSSETVECFRQARLDLLSQIDAQRLCSRMGSIAPARCFRIARERGFLSQQEAIQLCECADTTAPIDCFLEATRTTSLSRLEAVRLCMSADRSTVALVCRQSGVPVG